jgi:sigma-B regulation protein RsbU (phosphoserine phosphatase)
MDFSTLQEGYTELQKENTKLKTALSELTILNEIALTIGSTMSLSRMIEVIVKKCVRHFNVEQATVLLLDRQNSANPFNTIIRKADNTTEFLPMRLNDQLIGWMLKNEKALIVDDLANDERFRLAPDDMADIRSLVAIPLVLKGTMIGLACLFNKKDDQAFNESDIRLLTIISSGSAQIIENARLHQKEHELKRVQEELKVAAKIQRELLPEQLPQIEGYDLAAINLSAREVGGDYYDVKQLSPFHYMFCLGDVSGKGMPAALLMANLQATLRSQADISKRAFEVVQIVNNAIYENTSSDRFITLFYGVLNTSTHTLTICNAGHEPAFFEGPESGFAALHTGGTVLGFKADFPFDEELLQMQIEDCLLIYSDGITEAMDAEHNDYTEQRLKAIFQENSGKSANQILNAIIHDVKAHTAGHLQSDDMTLFILKRKKVH